MSLIVMNDAWELSDISCCANLDSSDGIEEDAGGVKGCAGVEHTRNERNTPNSAQRNVMNTDLKTSDTVP